MLITVTISQFMLYYIGKPKEEQTQLILPR
jgi:hypothetical protein